MELSINSIGKFEEQLITTFRTYIEKKTILVMKLNRRSKDR